MYINSRQTGFAYGCPSPSARDAAYAAIYPECRRAMNAMGESRSPERVRAKTLAELLGIAIAIERAAADQYDRYAKLLDARRNARVAGLFRELAEQERAHERHLLRWAERHAIQPVPSEEIGPAPLPESGGARRLAEAGGPYLLTPLQAIGLALGNEERAFSFFSEIAATSRRDEVRELAELLAKDELDHIARLRAARRLLRRAERPSEPIVGREWIERAAHDASSLEALAGSAEKALAGLLSDLAAAVDAETAPGSRAFLAELAEHQHRCATAYLEADLWPQRVAQFQRRLAGGRADPSGEAVEALITALQAADAAFELYGEVADRAVDEKLLRWAQSLAETALQRLLRIRDRLAEVDPDWGQSGSR